MFRAFGLDATYEIVSVGTNVHELLRRMMRDYGDDLGGVDLLAVLREYMGERCPEGLRGGKFTDVVLAFDFDPQDNRLDVSALRRLQETFCDSTDMGQLYVSYPSVESLRDFSSFGDEGFLESSVPLDVVSHAHAYKTLVSDRDNGLGDISRIGGPKFAAIVAMHASKAQHLVYGVEPVETAYWSGGDDLSAAASEIDPLLVFDFEVGSVESRKMIYPLCTLPLFVSAWPSFLNGAWRKWLASGPF